MATYSYILCTSCGGTGTTYEKTCPKCQGARMTAALVNEHLYRALDIAGCDALQSELNRLVELGQLA